MDILVRFRHSIENVQSLLAGIHYAQGLLILHELQRDLFFTQSADEVFSGSLQIGKKSRNIINDLIFDS